MNNRTGEIIEKYRKERGLTQGDLARKLGVSNSAISKWEHGTNLPDITLLEPLSEILGIDKLMLFTSENEAKEDTSERIKSIKKNNLIKTSITILLFLLSVIFTNYVSYKIYTHKLNQIESSQTEVYRFYSKDEEFFINGYLIFKNDESIVVFDQLNYQSRKKQQSSDKIESVELKFYDDNESISRLYYKNDKKYKSINEVFSELNKNNDKNIKMDKFSLDNFSIKIFINYDNYIEIKDVKIEVSQ